MSDAWVHMCGVLCVYVCASDVGFWVCVCVCVMWGLVWGGECVCV